jgi:hypothetical protein
VNDKVRIEYTGDNDTKIIHDLRSGATQVYRWGQEWTEADTIKKYKEQAYKTWINDSYWLCMPFKMLDGGVHVRYKGDDTTATGIPSNVITMTFDSVGVTPKNKYEVWVGQYSHLVTQWAFYANASDTVAAMITPWDGYTLHNGVFLSTDRGEKRSMSGIKTYEKVPNEVFTKIVGTSLSEL